jgi:pimeloyl-ACP methyl ester carboxylesterase
VAVIMLGTNDTCAGRRANWEHHADLEADLRAMIADLRGANPEVTVHLAGPLPMFFDKPGLKPERVSDLTGRAKRLPEIWRAFQQVAAAEPKVLWHDLGRVLKAEDTTDGVHPTTEGHDKLARHLAELLGGGFDESCSAAADLGSLGVEVKAGDFHGFVRHDFTPPGIGRPAIVVAPWQAAAGRPWIWRARFFGHEPGLDLQLLDRGWHVAHVDVANLYGGPKAMEVWDGFYDLATTRLGLSAKPVLEGMSRGGLPIFYWAIRHPQRVAAVYGDNPVCDFRTWPGGLDGSRGSKGDWARLLAAWGIDGEQAKTHPQVVDRIERLAAAKVPVALVVGTADTTVPPAANAEAVAKRYAELGGPVKVWRKPGLGHHPHGLHPPDELRRYLVEAWRE